jgi:hypothetical protein
MKMDWLKSLYPDIREVVKDSLPSYWPELGSVLAKLLSEPIPPV